jgi:hypothetical protein
MLRTIVRSTLMLLVATALPAQRPAVPAAPPWTDPLHEAGRNVTVSLVTAGNGDEVWELFGHSAIWIHDNLTGRDTVFNWGVFDSRQPHFIPHFLQGLMLYQMGGDTMDQLLYAYRYLNRSVVSQELDLTTAEKDSLLHLIQINARPENLQYRYDYFVDNCATRPRDLLDTVLGGQLRAHTNRPSGTSYRWHTLRLMQGNKPLVLGVDIGLGEPSDREITQWQEMFLPRKLHDYVATLNVRDSAHSGPLRPLVRSERVLYQANGRRPEAEAPPALGRWLWPIGLLIAVPFAWLGIRARDGQRGVRIAAALVLGAWCLAAGLLGVILTSLWTVTDHVFAHANENLLLFNPFWLVLAVLIGIQLWTGGAARATRMLAIGLAGLSVLALAAHVAGLSREANWPMIGLALPPALAIALAAATNRSRRVPSPLTASAKSGVGLPREASRSPHRAPSS